MNANKKDKKIWSLLGVFRFSRYSIKKGKAPMLENDIITLVEKYLNGTASEEEEALLMKHYEDIAQENADIPTEELEEANAHIMQGLAAHINDPSERSKVIPIFSSKLKWIAAAVVIGIILTGGVLFYTHRTIEKQGIETASLPKVFNTPHVEGKATLALANGTVVLLDEVKDGTIAIDEGTEIIKQGENIIYRSNGAQVNASYHTITTPRKGKYTITLADGTKVWLNNVSSLKYPVAFNGSSREVVLTGEAYFDVRRNESMPFIVHSNSTVIEVLGTKFNVNAYSEDKKVKTTLLSGKVQVTGSGNMKTLNPGQQAISNESEIAVSDSPDMDETIAWMKDMFYFKNADIRTIMQQLSRWYDVEIVYLNINNEKYFAEMPQRNNIGETLKLLELTGKVKFKIEGKKVFVTEY